MKKANDRDIGYRSLCQDCKRVRAKLRRLETAERKRGNSASDGAADAYELAANELDAIVKRSVYKPDAKGE